MLKETTGYVFLVDFSIRGSHYPLCEGIVSNAAFVYFHVSVFINQISDKPVTEHRVIKYYAIYLNNTCNVYLILLFKYRL